MHATVRKKSVNRNRSKTAHSRLRKAHREIPYKLMAAKTPPAGLLRRLRRLRLWPMLDTPAYYRRVAASNHLTLMRAVLRHIADRAVSP